MSEYNVSDFNFRNTKLAKIPLSKIRENLEALRPVVDKETEAYQGGLDSVKKRGVLIPILVREITDPATGEQLYGLIDGLHRFNWAMDAGLTEIPANVGSLQEADLLEAQMLANVHKIETQPMQYTRALLKVLAANPALTVIELAGRLSKSVTWLSKRLHLVKLTEPIQKLVNDGTLGLSNAYALTDLPEDKQQELLSQAISKSPAEFIPLATTIQKEIDKAKREGRKAETDKFMPSAYLQKMPLIRDEAEMASVNPNNSRVIAEAKANGVNSVESAIAYALKWTLHLDPVSIATDTAKWEQEKEDQKKAAEERKIERAKKKIEEAHKVAAGAV